MADIITIAMTPEQYAVALKAMPAASVVKQFTSTSPLTGTVLSKQLDFDYAYDGTAEMSVTILARHGLGASIASDAEIKAHLEDEVMTEA